MLDNEKLWNIASIFRMAIEKAKLDGRFAHDCRFRSFPSGCCDDTSALLSEYLTCLGVDCKIIEGTYYDDDPEITSSHGWIEINNETIIDITGDQYKYNTVTRFSEAVYVGKYTEFYRMFRDNLFTELRGIHGEMVRKRRLTELYNIICEYLEKDNV